MKGLFVKDLKLMMLQKNFLLLILAIVIGMMIFTDDVIFPLGFLSLLQDILRLSQQFLPLRLYVMMILIMEMRFCLHYLLHVIIM